MASSSLFSTDLPFNKNYEYSNYLFSSFTSHAIQVDGKLDEWNHLPGIIFSGPDYVTSPQKIIDNYLNDNAAVVKVQWDHQKLYIAFVVYDVYLTTTKAADNFNQDDCLDFYISTALANQPHYEFLTDQQFQFTINADGLQETYKGYNVKEKRRKHGNRNLNWTAEFSSSIALKGTINNHAD